MVLLAREFGPFLSQCTLCATGTTGARLAAELGLHIERMLSGTLTPQPHEPDINALVRACDVHDAPCTTNLSTARLVLRQLAQRHAT
jgi:methylglyoxal synthase